VVVCVSYLQEIEPELLSKINGKRKTTKRRKLQTRKGWPTQLLYSFLLWNWENDFHLKCYVLCALRWTRGIKKCCFLSKFTTLNRRGAKSYWFHHLIGYEISNVRNESDSLLSYRLLSQNHRERRFNAKQFDWPAIGHAAFNRILFNAQLQIIPFPIILDSPVNPFGSAHVFCSYYFKETKGASPWDMIEIISTY
jgi:hypothetical protein